MAGRFTFHVGLNVVKPLSHAHAASCIRYSQTFHWKGVAPGGTFQPAAGAAGARILRPDSLRDWIGACVLAGGTLLAAAATPEWPFLLALSLCDCCSLSTVSQDGSGAQVKGAVVVTAPGGGLCDGRRGFEVLCRWSATWALEWAAGLVGLALTRLLTPACSASASSPTASLAMTSCVSDAAESLVPAGGGRGGSITLDMTGCAGPITSSGGAASAWLSRRPATSSSSIRDTILLRDSS